jgi:catechol 2,3-dioxygenase
VPESPRPGQLAYGIPPPAHRLPAATHVGGVHLLVSDLPRSRAFYEQVLGLRPLAGEAGQATFGAQGDDRILVTLRTRPATTGARRGALGLYHFAILLPDRAALGRFAAHLSTMGVRAGMADHLVSEALYLSDPDGLGIEVYVDRPQHTWRHHDRQLAMTTDRLDLQSVIAAAGGAAWDGAPPGTTMGHMHLHVGSLADAEAFYHRALGLDKTVWNYPGALFLSAGGYHHHLGTNTWAPGPAPSADQAQLLEWELVVPSAEDVAAVGRSLQAGGYSAEHAAEGVTAQDPWGTRMRIRGERRHEVETR